MEKKIETLNEEKVETQHEEKNIMHKFSEAENALSAHTKTGSIIVYLIVVASFVLLVTTGRGAVAVQLSMGALILALLQNLWQGISLEVFLRYLEHNDIKEFHTWPDAIGNGGWAIYVMKMIVAILAAVELILSV